MHPSPPSRRRIPRLAAAVVMSLAAVAGSLATIVSAPPAGAVPVDGLYTGTIRNPATGGGSASLTVVLSTSSPNRDPVTATVTLGTGVSVNCVGMQGVPAGTITFTGNGGVNTAAPGGQAALTLTGNTSVGPVNIPITINADVTHWRNRIAGDAVLDLPGYFPYNCADVTLNFIAESDQPWTIRTGHDYRPDLNGIDINHMIDRHQAGTPTPWERCMYLWASTNGAAVPSGTDWTIEGPAPTGARIRPGWEHGTPPSEMGDGTPAPLRTMVCISDATLADQTFTVAIAPTGGAVTGRILLWVGEYVDYEGRAQGDVHNTTFDGFHYDFQGVGEYVDAATDTGKDFAVQSRLEAVPGAPVTVTTAIAVQVYGDRVAVYLDPSSGVPSWYLDGKPVKAPVALPSGGEITNPTADHWRVTWPKGTWTEGTSMQVSFARWTPMDHLNIDELKLGWGLSSVGRVDGLLGSPDRDAANDLTPSYGGPPVSPDIDPKQPAYTQPLYRDFGRSWLVDTKGGPQQTLFDYLDPAHPDPGSYENEHFPAERPNVVEPRARAACLKAGVTAFPQIDFCTYDVSITGAREIADYYRDGWFPV